MNSFWIIGLAALFISMPQAFAEKSKACNESLSEVKISKKMRSALLEKINIEDGYVFSEKDIKNLVVIEKSSSNMRIYFVDQEKIGSLINIQLTQSGEIEKVIFEQMLNEGLSEQALERISDRSYIPYHILDRMMNMLVLDPRDIQDIEVVQRSSTGMIIHVQHTSGGIFTVNVKTDMLSEVKKMTLEYQQPR